MERRRQQSNRSRWRHPLARWLYQPYKYLVFAPAVVASTLVFGTLTMLLTFVLEPRTVSRLCGVTWARLNAWLTPMRVSVAGRDHIDLSQSYVVVCNHQSHYDVYVLYGFLGIDFRWVMKQELRRVPGLGIGCARLGHIFIDRSNTGAALASIAAAKETIRNGTSVLFFPEGTRSCGPEMLQFKRGAFHLAIDLGLPILPLTIVGTADVLPPRSLDLKPGAARLVIHPPISIEGVDRNQVGNLVDRVRQVIDSARQPHLSS